MIPKVVLCTNVLFSALYSNRGASYKLLSQIGLGKFDIAISVALLFEYEDVLKRSDILSMPFNVVDDILDYICKVGNCSEIFYLWRPQLKDPKDDFVLELAVNSGCEMIVTYNKKDFSNVKNKFGLRIVDPHEFLKILGEE